MIWCQNPVLIYAADVHSVFFFLRIDNLLKLKFFGVIWFNPDLFTYLVLNAIE